MNVSHFELIFKPQSPEGAADTVLQGYFLTITNLEEVELSFRLDFVTTAIGDPTRTLAGNTFVAVDIAGGNNDFTYDLQGTTASKSFRLSPFVIIPPHATAKIAVLPDDPFPAPIGDGTADPADYEARGYVTLRLPALFKRIAGRFQIVRQLDRPANVLLSAQNRATYLRTDGSINSQTQSSLPLASGSALTTIPAEKGLQLEVPFDRFDLELDLNRLPLDLDLDRVPVMLAEMLAVAAASGVDTKAFNAALKEAGIGMALERRQVAVEAAE
jgi:hypothetical protein